MRLSSSQTALKLSRLYLSTFRSLVTKKVILKSSTFFEITRQVFSSKLGSWSVIFNYFNTKNFLTVTLTIFNIFRHASSESQKPGFTYFWLKIWCPIKHISLLYNWGLHKPSLSHHKIDLCMHTINLCLHKSIQGARWPE